MKIGSWKQLEERVYQHGRERMTHYGVFIHRFLDTRAAGSFVSPQPSDFLVLPQAGGRALFLETKYSEAHDTLRQCFSNAVSGQQLASARLVTRAKADYRVLFYSGLSGLCELWDGMYLAECRSSGTRLNLSARLAVASRVDEVLDQHVLRLIKFQS
jgi:hypothetical protein